MTAELQNLVISKMLAHFDGPAAVPTNTAAMQTAIREIAKIYDVGVPGVINGMAAVSGIVPGKDPILFSGDVRIRNLFNTGSAPDVYIQTSHISNNLVAYGQHTMNNQAPVWALKSDISTKLKELLELRGHHTKSPPAAPTSPP